MAPPNSHHQRKRSSKRKLTQLLLSPLRLLVNAFTELRAAVEALFGFLWFPIGRGRRNRDFDQAGRPTANRGPRINGTAVFREGERERVREAREADKLRQRLERQESEEALEYRQQLEDQKIDVSRGDIVNHLARMNAKSRTASDAASSDSQQPSADSSPDP